MRHNHTRSREDFLIATTSRNHRQKREWVSIIIIIRLVRSQSDSKLDDATVSIAFAERAFSDEIVSSETTFRTDVVGLAIFHDVNFSAEQKKRYL